MDRKDRDGLIPELRELSKAYIDEIEEGKLQPQDLKHTIEQWSMLGNEYITQLITDKINPTSKKVGSSIVIVD